MALSSRSVTGLATVVDYCGISRVRLATAEKNSEGVKGVKGVLSVSMNNHLGDGTGG